MYDSRVQRSGDMCMTLSGHTSTLPRLVVQGYGFEASFLRWARLDFSPQRRRFLTKAMKSLSGLHSSISCSGCNSWMRATEFIPVER